MDKHNLNIHIFTQTEDGEILEALMNCPQCHRQFPVIYGIPVLIPDEYRDKTLEEPILKKWDRILEENHSVRKKLKTHSDE